MKTFVISAVALSLASTTVAANGDDWASLDQQVDALASSLAMEGDGPNLSGYMLIDYTSNSDKPVGEADDSFFDVNKARLAAKGTQGIFGYKLQHDFASNSIKDAYVRFEIGGNVKGQIGNYKSPVLRSGLISSSNQFFRNRTANGSVWGERQEGAMIMGEFDMLDFAVSLQNGTDGNSDDYLLAARVEANIIGDGPGKGEGAAFATNGNSPGGAIGLSFFDDGGATNDGDGAALDFNISAASYSFGLEIVQIGEGVFSTDPNGTPNDGDETIGLGQYDSKGGILEADTTPFSFQGTYMFSPETAEVGVRYQDFDTADNGANPGAEMIEIGLNRYWALHKAKAGIFIEDYSDDANGDQTIYGVRVGVAF